MLTLHILSAAIVHAFGFSSRRPSTAPNELHGGRTVLASDQNLDQLSRPVQTVWLVGLPRSGTSIVQKIVAHAAIGQGVPVFAMFEPCHPNDKFKGSKIGYDASVAAQCLRRALACDFDEIDTHTHSASSGRILDGTRASPWPAVYSGPQISKLCSESSIRVFKTIYPGPTGLTEISELVGDMPGNSQLIQIGRDPRAIYSSLVANRDKFPAEAETSFIPALCNHMVEWANDSQKYGGHLGSLSMLQVRFETLLKNPIDGILEILNYLKWSSSHELEQFLEGHMFASSCSPDSASSYSECRTPEHTEMLLTKWRHNLNSSQLEEFESGSCKQAVSIFGYIPPILQP